MGKVHFSTSDLLVMEFRKINQSALACYRSGYESDGCTIPAKQRDDAITGGRPLLAFGRRLSRKFKSNLFRMDFLKTLC